MIIAGLSKPGNHHRHLLPKHIVMAVIRHHRTPNGLWSMLLQHIAG